MRKWVVPQKNGKGYKLVVSESCPSGAACEAPENFTREMANFITSIIPVDGKLVPKVATEAYLEKVKEMEATREMLVEERKLKKISVAQYNKMNPAQRFVKNILGELVTAAKPALFSALMGLIFGKKLN